VSAAEPISDKTKVSMTTAVFANVVIAVVVWVGSFVLIYAKLDNRAEKAEAAAADAVEYAKSVKVETLAAIAVAKADAESKFDDLKTDLREIRRLCDQLLQRKNVP
jgi:uncharacterized protein (UPF0333 family)